MLSPMKVLALPLLLGLAACGPHAAQFSKSDMTTSQRDADYDDCQQQAGIVAAAALETGGVSTDAVRTVQVDALRNCMLSKGYSD